MFSGEVSPNVRVVLEGFGTSINSTSERKFGSQEWASKECRRYWLLVGQDRTGSDMTLLSRNIYTGKENDVKLRMRG